MITVINKTNSPYDLRGVWLPAKGAVSHDGWPDGYVDQLRAAPHLYDVHDEDAPIISEVPKATPSPAPKRGRPRKDA